MTDVSEVLIATDNGHISIDSKGTIQVYIDDRLVSRAVISKNTNDKIKNMLESYSFTGGDSN